MCRTVRDPKGKPDRIGTGRYDLIVSKNGYRSARVEKITVEAGVPQRIGVGEVFVTLNPLVKLSPYDQPPPN